jgi:hypothetical protein
VALAFGSLTQIQKKIVSRYVALLNETLAKYANIPELFGDIIKHVFCCF